jgi:hypothetical protein
VSNQFETTSDGVEPGLIGSAQEDIAKPQTTLIPADLPQKRKRKSDKKKPLDPIEDEAIAQYLASPKSIREFKSFSELAARFKISRMTVYGRSKDPRILARAEWLLEHHKRAGDLIARLSWPRIMAGQVKAAAAGDTKAAQFCKAQAWPEAKDESPLGFFRQ